MRLHESTAIGKNSLLISLSFINMASIINEFKDLSDKIKDYLKMQFQLLKEQDIKESQKIVQANYLNPKPGLIIMNKELIYQTNKTFNEFFKIDIIGLNVDEIF